MPDDSVSVVLALGANLGDRAATLHSAVRLLGAAGLNDIVVSNMYATEPVGVTAQPDFLNMAVRGTTRASAHDLALTCRKIERELGRQPRAQWHEREIDIDIILYADMIIDTDDLQIPHPRMHMRRFVLMPVSDIAAEMIHPVLHVSMQDLLSHCSDASRVELVDQHFPG